MTYLIELLPEGLSGSRHHQQQAAYGLLCRLIGETTPLSHHANGQPYLPAYPNLHISISHCRAAVAVAVSERRAVGIDIESRRKVSPSLLQRTCTAEEIDAIQLAADPQMAFLQFWTRKEAVLKCRGIGIQGFGSMVAALSDSRYTVSDLDCGHPDLVAALAEDLMDE